jgi:hypothetical protein
MPEKTTRKFWGSTKEAGFAAFDNAMMKSGRPSCRPATFGFQRFPTLWPARFVGTISAQHGLEEMKNPKSCRPATFRRTTSKAALPAPSPPARLIFGDCFAYACAQHLAQPLMLKGTNFPYKESRPPKRPPECEGDALSGQGQGACWAFRSISRPRRTPGFRTLRIAELRSL